MFFLGRRKKVMNKKQEKLAKELLNSFVEYLIEQEAYDYEDAIINYYYDKGVNYPEYNSSYEVLAEFAKTHIKPEHVFQDIVRAKELLKEI
jgi:hypothetical protein